MARMTVHMVRALSDAEASYQHAGLQKTVAGWKSSHRRAAFGYHAPGTIIALVGRGYLELWNKERNAHITSTGQNAIEEWRRQLKRSA